MADRYWVGGTGTWNTISTTNWSTSSGGGSGASVPTASDSVFFDSNTTYTVTMTGALTCLNLTVSTGTVTFATGTTPTLAVSGSFSISSNTVWNSTGTITFNATSSQTITTNGVSLTPSITFNGVGGTWQLQDNLTVSPVTDTKVVTLTNGTLDVNGKILTTPHFSSTNTNTRTIAFGSGSITVNGTNGTLGYVWTTSTITGLTITGTPIVNVDNNTATAASVTPGSLDETNSISFNFISGTYTLGSFSSCSAKNVSFSGFSGTHTLNALTVYGNLTLSSTMTVVESTTSLTFAATSGTKTITSNGKTVGGVVFNGVGGTWQLQDSMTVGSTRTTSLTNGTLDLSFSSGQILTTGLFASSSNVTTRTLAFGSGSIKINGTGTIWNTAAITGLTVTGTPIVNVDNNTATAATVNTGALSETNSISFNFISGTYTLTFLGSANYTAKNVDFTGFGGTWGATSTGTIYGDLKLSTGMTLTTSASTMTFGATSGTKNITTSGKTIDFPLTFNGSGGTWKLIDALTMGSTRALTHTNGTINLDGKTLTVGTAYTTATGTKNLTFTGGTLVCPNSGATAFNNAAPTNYTTTAGAGIGKISMTSGSAKTFVGGGSTFNCTLSNDGAGALTITGSNTFTALGNGVQPTTFTFTAGTTTTLTNWYVKGTSGNLVTIGSATAASHTLSKSSGAIAGNYLSISRSTATGGAIWYAGSGSTDGGNNSGWLFKDPTFGKFFEFF